MTLLTSILDRRADEQRGQMLKGTYVRPNGTGQHVITLPGSSQEIVVPATVHGLTWRPGDAVMLGAFGHDVAIIGDPPFGHQGGAAFVPASYPAASEPASLYHGFSFEELRIIATVYNRGRYVSERSDLAFAVEQLAYPVYINRDSSGAVGDGSLLWGIVIGGDLGGIRVWDVPGGASYSYVPEEDVRISMASFHAGWVYWFECPTETAPSVTVTFTLWRSRATLASPEVVDSHEFPGPGLTGGTAWWSGAALAISEEAATVWARWETLEDSAGATMLVRIPLAGGDGQHFGATVDALDADLVPRTGAAPGIPEPSGGSVLTSSNSGATSTVQARPDALETAASWSDLWPVDGLWAIDNSIYSGYPAAATTRDGNQLGLYDGASFWLAPSFGSYGPSPTERFAVAPREADGLLPALFYPAF